MVDLLPGPCRRSGIGQDPSPLAAYDAPQSAHILAAIPNQPSHVSWMGMTVEDGTFGVGEQQDLGFNRMIYESADY